MGLIPRDVGEGQSCNQLQPLAGLPVTSDNTHLSLPTPADFGQMWPSCIQLQGDRGGDPVQRYLDACWAEATKRAYAADVRDFLAWGGEVPATPDIVAAYLAERAARLAPATLARRLAGIRAAHVAAGFRDPTRDPLVGRVLKGIRRVHGVAQRRARPLDPRMLGLGWDQYADLRGKRDRALVLLGFYGAFRRSELVGLDVQDLVWSERGLSIRLRKSKTDQVQASPSGSAVGEGNALRGQGGEGLVGGQRHWARCPVPVH